MKKKRINRNLLFMILLLCVTIGYAYLNSELRINGTTGIAGNSWDIHFENVVPSQSNTATVNVAPVANPQDKVTELTYSVRFNKPGDVYEFNVDVVNAGTIDAMIESFTSKIKIGDGEEQIASPSTIPSYMKYYVTYADGVKINNNHLLNASSSETITVQIEYKEDITASELEESSGKTITFINELKYTQATEEATEKPVRLNCTYEGDLVNGATYTNGQYSYQYSSSTDGWRASLIDKNSTDPVTTPLCSTINGKPIKDMSGMFYNSKATSIDLSSFDTSNVTNMNSMFYNVLVEELNLSSFNTKNVTTMANMFADASNITSIDLSELDTSNVITMVDLFKNNTNLETINMSKLDFSKVSHGFGSVLNGATLTSLKNLDVSNSKFGVDMSYAFSGASNLESLNIDNINTSMTTNMERTFSNLPKITSLNLSGLDTSNVTTVYGIFSSDIGLTSIDISSWDNRNMIIATWMMGGCSNLESVNFSNWDMRRYNQTNHIARMISGSSYGVTTSAYPKLKRINVSNTKFFDEMIATFAYLYPVEEIVLTGINTTTATSMREMFMGDSNLKTIDLSSFNTSNVTNMTAMFQNTTNLSELDLSSFDTNSVTTVSSMFQGTGATTGYARTQTDADKLNASGGKPSTLTFVVKP